MGEEILLAEATIKVNDIRSKISNLSNLFDNRRNHFYRDEIDFVAQIEEIEIEDEIEKLEIEKAQLDNKIQITNWTTDLID